MPAKTERKHSSDLSFSVLEVVLQGAGLLDMNRAGTACPLNGI